MDPFITTKDPYWHRLVDGLVILAIGMAIGVAISQVFTTYETEVTTSRIIRRAPVNEAPGDSSAEVNAPQDSIRVLEL